MMHYIHYCFCFLVFCRKHSKTSWQVSIRIDNEIISCKSVVLDFNFNIFWWLIFNSTDLNLSYPKMIDIAVPANMVCGLQDVEATVAL